MSPKKLKLPVASDHAGFELKEWLKKEVKEIDWVDEGPLNSERTDYPDYAAKVAKLVSEGSFEKGLLICGSGIGMSIAANKFPGVRAAVVESEQTARLSKNHNDSNILCLGSRILSPEYAKTILNAWLDAQFEGGRHEDRIAKITLLEKHNDKNR